MARHTGSLQERLDRLTDKAGTTFHALAREYGCTSKVMRRVVMLQEASSHR